MKTTKNLATIAFSYLISPRFRELQGRIQKGDNDPKLLEKRDDLAKYLNNIMEIALQDNDFRKHNAWLLNLQKKDISS